MADSVSDVPSERESIIRVMPETLANKIAAGEVVQRPASVAKELIENALDAGADEIQLILKEAGSELIQVVDDGCGMTPEDAAASFKRHATSKISTIDDLERIRTLGFRGEALASIGAVARVELRTKRVQDAAGTCLRIEGGEQHPPEPCATQAGTSVAVRQLFFNVPARRNFLKTPATELKHLVETFQFLALSNPDVAFRLVHDDNEVYRVGAARGGDFYAGLRRRVRDLFGEEHAAHLVPVEETTSYLSIAGFVGAPDFHRRSRGEQFLFINGRYVKDRSLDHAVRAGFGDLIPERAYPFYTLFLQIDPRHVDVNVHPTKAEVKFDDDRGVYAFMKTVVKKALGTAYMVPQVDGAGDAGEEREAAAPSFARSGGARPFETGGEAPPRFSTPRPMRPSGGDAGPRRPVGGEGPYEPPGDLSEKLYGPIPAGGGREAPPPAEAVERGSADGALLWQLHGQYVLTQIRSGLMILDQNAAHERILYERALGHMRSGDGASQQLLFPRTLEFNPADFEQLKELLPDLRALGFDLELFSGRSVVVRGVPADVRSGDEATLLEELLEQFQAYADRLQLRGRDNLGKSAARRMAIRPGTRLSTTEMRSLIDQLFECEMPYACPHGRPTFIKIPFEELDKRFGR